MWAGAGLSVTGATDNTEGLMTNKIGSAVTNKVLERITGPAGLDAELGALTQAERDFAGVVPAAQVRAQNVAVDIAERGTGVKYPAVAFTAKIVITTAENSSARRVTMTIELRQSQTADGIHRLALCGCGEQMFQGDRGGTGATECFTASSTKCGTER
jgi:hypothetical protein